MTFNASKQVKAKKTHRCDYCGSQIDIDELYMYWAGIDNNVGEFCTQKTHALCHDFLVAVTDEFELCSDDGVPDIGAVANDGDLSAGTLAMLQVMKERVKAARATQGEDDDR